MVTVVQLAKGWTTWVRFLAEAIIFLLFHVVETGSGAHPASDKMGTKISFSGSKAAET
jgi:hypothetical protein